MSTESNPGGVQVRSSNNVYTLLLIVAFVALAAAAVYMGSVNKERFGFSMPVGEQYEDSQKAAEEVGDDATAHGKRISDSLKDVRTLTTGLDSGSAPSQNP